MPVYKPEKLGLPQGANQLLFNDGTVVGRCAAAKKNRWRTKLRYEIFITNYP